MTIAITWDQTGSPDSLSKRNHGEVHWANSRQPLASALASALGFRPVRTGIREVDLKPLPLLPFTIDGRRIAPRKQRLLTPHLDEETQQVFILIDDALGIDLASETRAELEASYAALLPHLWRSYAMADDSKLAADARHLKARLLEAYAEVGVAAQEP